MAINPGPGDPRHAGASRRQRLDKNGYEAFPHNGVEVSAEAARSKLNPSMAQAGGDLIVFFNKRNSL